jgi:hypothetical protein
MHETLAQTLSLSPWRNSSFGAKFGVKIWGNLRLRQEPSTDFFLIFPVFSSFFLFFLFELDYFSDLNGMN